MAVPSRHGRHSAPRGRRGRRAAPLFTFLAVLLVAVGGWALVGRGGPAPDASREAGLLAESGGPARVTADPTGTSLSGTPPSGTPTVERGSRDAERAAPVPRLGTMVPAPPARTTTRPTGTPPRRPTSTPSAPTTTWPATPAPPAPTSSAPGTPAGSTAEAEVTRLTNIERAKAGCPAVRADARLAAAAEAHSRDMVDRDYFSHTSPDGEGPGDRAEAAGYPRWSGENIAAGYATPAAVVQGWMDSEGHRANILNCSSKATGVGFDERENMWTQMFGFE